MPTDRSRSPSPSPRDSIGDKRLFPVSPPYRLHFPDELARNSHDNLKSNKKPGTLVKGRPSKEFVSRVKNTKQPSPTPLSIESPRKGGSKHVPIAITSQANKFKRIDEHNTLDVVLPNTMQHDNPLPQQLPKESSKRKDNTSSVRQKSSPHFYKNMRAGKVEPTTPEIKSTTKNSQTYLQLLEACKISNKKFTDTMFPPESRSLYNDPRKPPQNWANKIEWKRIGDFLSDPHMFVDGVEPGDVIQGCLGDCWFLGALSLVATRESLLLKCIPTTTTSKWGIYEFRFYKNGEWQNVIIDDYIPLYNNKPIFSSCLDLNEVWVMLIEKAYAKLHKTYENLEGGSETYALVDLTGGAPETVELDSQQSLEEFQNGHLWQRLTKFHTRGYLMGCTMIVQGAEAEVNTGQGILQNHAYAILDVQVVNGANLLRIRNPWGQGEWKGAWSDESKEWNQAILQQLNYKFGDDGTFWMELSDFVRQFNRLHFLRMFDESWKHKLIVSEWKGVTAGGCGNFPTWKDNPQFAFTVDEPCDVFIALSQFDTRINLQPTTINIGYILLKTEDISKKINQIQMQNVVGQTTFTNSREGNAGSGKFVLTASVSKKFRLEQRGNYVISATTFHPKKESAFWLSMYCQTSQPFDVWELGKPARKPKDEPKSVFTAYLSDNPANVVRSAKLPSAPSPTLSPSKPKSPQKLKSRPTTPSLNVNDLQNCSVTTLTELQTEISNILARKTQQGTVKNIHNGAPISPLSTYLNGENVRSRAVSILASADYTLAIAQMDKDTKKKQRRNLRDGWTSEFESQESEEEVDELNRKVSEHLKELATLAQTALQQGKARDEAGYYYKMAILCDEVDDFEEAVGHYAQFLAVVKEVGDTLAEALAYNHLGIDLYYLGGRRNLQKSIEYHIKHDELTRDLGSRFIANCNLGISYNSLGEYMTAIAHFRQALGFAVQSGDLEAQSLVCDYLAFSAVKTRDFAVARVYLERRLKIMEQLQDFKAVIEIHQQIGELLLAWKGSFEEDAIAHFKGVVKVAESRPGTALDASAYQRLGEIAASEGDYRTAKSYFSRALLIAQEAEDVDTINEASSSLNALEEGGSTFFRAKPNSLLGEHLWDEDDIESQVRISSLTMPREGLPNGNRGKKSPQISTQKQGRVSRNTSRTSSLQPLKDLVEPEDSGMESACSMEDVKLDSLLGRVHDKGQSREGSVAKSKGFNNGTQHNDRYVSTQDEEEDYESDFLRSSDFTSKLKLQQKS